MLNSESAQRVIRVLRGRCAPEIVFPDEPSRDALALIGELGAEITRLRQFIAEECASVTDSHGRKAARFIGAATPTKDMLVAGYEAMGGQWGSCREAYEAAERCYRAMIAAAPPVA